MKYTLVLFILLAIPAAAQYTPPDSCIVEGYLLKPNLQPAPGKKVEVLKAIIGGHVTTYDKESYESDETGYIRMVLIRNSRTWLYGRDVLGLDKPGGVQLSIPDAADARLEQLPPSITVPPLYIAAVPVPNNYGDSLHVADSLARAAIALAEAAANGEAVHAADSIARHADSLAAVALDSASTARQDLLIAIAQLQAQLDTAGTHTRVTLYAQIAGLYASLGAVEQQIADISARIDTVGAFDRIANAARNAQQDSDIAAKIEVETDPVWLSEKTGYLTAESDPTISARFDSVFTQGERSINTSKRYTVDPDSITFTAGVKDVIDCKLGNVFRGTLTHSDTLFFANIPTDVSQTINVRITNAGAYTLTFWNDVGWSGETAPTITATANKRTWLTFIIAGGIVDGVSVLNFP